MLSQQEIDAEIKAMLADEGYMEDLYDDFADAMELNDREEVKKFVLNFAVPAIAEERIRAMNFR